MNMMTIDCMLSRRREKFKTKMVISSKQQSRSSLLVFAYQCINCIVWYLFFKTAFICRTVLA